MPDCAFEIVVPVLCPQNSASTLPTLSTLFHCALDIGLHIPDTCAQLCSQKSAMPHCALERAPVLCPTLPTVPSKERQTKHYGLAEANTSVFLQHVPLLKFFLLHDNTVTRFSTLKAGDQKDQPPRADTAKHDSSARLTRMNTGPHPNDRSNQSDFSNRHCEGSDHLSTRVFPKPSLQDAH